MIRHGKNCIHRNDYYEEIRFLYSEVPRNRTRSTQGEALKQKGNRKDKRKAWS